MEAQAPHLHIRTPRRSTCWSVVGIVCLLLAIALCATLLIRPHALSAQDAAPLPNIFLSEVLPNPRAVPDSGGEWVELLNGGAEAINLAGWQLRVGSGYSSTLCCDLWIAPGGYGVLAELPNPLENGGVTAHGLLPGLVLNDVDTLELYTPDGQLVERAAWSEQPAVQEGRSLERTVFDRTTGSAPAWTQAWQPWPSSAGDWGSPGAAWTPPPTPPTPPTLLISELLPDPAAVADDLGEWVELYNPNPFPVALAGWTLTNAQNSVQIVGALDAPALGYVVLGRSADVASNGGVAVQALLTMQLANDGGSLVLRAPSGAQIDEVTWPGSLAGRSLERLADGATWRNGVQPWPGSAGDWGSPGAPPPPEPPTPTPTALPPTPQPLPSAWPRPLAGAPASPIQIDEVAYRGGDAEYVVLINTSAQSVALAGWQLGDAARPGDDEAMAFLPANATMPPGGAFVVARSGAAFAARWFVAPDAQFEATAPGTPVLTRNEWAAPGHLALDDSGDEVVLLGPDGGLADALCFGAGDCAALGLTGRLDAPDGSALQRIPGPGSAAAPDVRDRWAILPATPLEPLPWPAPRVPSARPGGLPGGLQAWWGVLEATSTWTPNGLLPPRALLAAAAAQGLDFVALADPEVHAPIEGAPVTLLPAWGWQADGDRAVIFAPARPDANRWPAGLADRNALLPWLKQQGAPFLWLDGSAPTLASTPGLAALPADTLASAADATALVESWRTAGGPLLPAGSTLPLPFAVAQSPPRYTGLAAQANTPDALREAIATRRGWMATDAGLWLLLTADNDSVWMGGTVAPSNLLQWSVRAGDRSGAALRVTLWEDGIAVATGEAQDGAPWSVARLAPPGAWFYATATRADGAFAVTAPIHVAQPSADSVRADVRIAEVLPRPHATGTVTLWPMPTMSTSSSSTQVRSPWRWRAGNSSTAAPPTTASPASPLARSM